MHLHARYFTRGLGSTIMIAAAGGRTNRPTTSGSSRRHSSRGADEAVRVHLRIGERFIGESLARNGLLIEKFVVVGLSVREA